MGVYNGEPKASHYTAHTDRTRIFYRTCEKKQQIECIVFCISRYLNQMLMNTYKLSRSLYQKLIILFNNSLICIGVYRGVPQKISLHHLKIGGYKICSFFFVNVLMVYHPFILARTSLKGMPYML